jgi:hypothetical protein
MRECKELGGAFIRGMSHHGDCWETLTDPQIKGIQTGNTIWRLIPIPAILPENEAIRLGEIFSSSAG